MDDLLVKSLLDETTATEEAQVEAWVAASTEAARRKQHFSTILEEGLRLNTAPPVDADAAWSRFQQRISVEGPKARRIQFPLRSALRAAAGLALLLGASVLLWYFWGTAQQSVFFRGEARWPCTSPMGRR